MPIIQSMAQNSQIRTVSNREMFAVVRDTLLDGESVAISVCGESMLPFFRSGATITIRPIQDGDIRKYNVVMADAERSFVVHRIIDIDGENITLLGDGNYKGTESVTRDKVYGIVDCSATHIFFAKIWLWLRPMRRFPLAVFRRIL